MKKLLTNKKLMSTLSLVLVAVMMIANINLGGVRAKADSGNTNQIAELKTDIAQDATSEFVGYYALDSYGNITGDSFGKTADAAKVEQDGIKAWKTITQDANDPTSYKVSVKVETSQTVQTNDTAVVLVMDTSESMNYKIDSDKTAGRNERSRLDYLKQAANDFINNLANSTSGNIKVSVVQFNLNATKVCDWKNIKNAAEKKIVVDSINGLKTDYYTNIEAGLLLANKRLQMDEVANYGNRYTVLFSDGEPTECIKTGKIIESTEKVEGSEYINASDYVASPKTICRKVNDAANRLKSESMSTIYSIFIGKDSSLCYDVDYDFDGTNYHKVDSNTYNYVDDNTYFKISNACNTNLPDLVTSKPNTTTYEAKSLINWKCKHCGNKESKHKTYYYSKEYNFRNANYTVANLLTDISSSYYSATDFSALTSALNETLKDIVDGADGKGWTVTDPMGAFIELKSEFNNVSNVAIEGANTIKWSLNPEDKAHVSSGPGTRPGETIYTYELEYDVRLLADGINFEDNTNYAVNGVTTLKYGDNTISFKVPVVKGTAPVYYYTTSYYQKNKETGKYVLFARTNSTEKINKTVTASAITEKRPENYILNDKDSKQSLTIGTGTTEEESNHLKIYYDPMTTSVKVVNHLITVSADNVTSEEKVTTENDYISQYNNKPIYVGERFELKEEDVRKIYPFGSVTYSYLKGHEGESLTISSLSDDMNKNVVHVYYEKDNRADATVYTQIIHTRNYWELVNGKYVPKTSKRESDEKLERESKQYANYTIDPYDSVDSGYNFDKVEFNGVETSTGASVTLNADKNIVKVYYKLTEDDRVKTDVKVIHNYTYNKYDVVNGVLTHKVVTGQSIDADTYKDQYIGEVITIDPKTTYNNKPYTLSNTDTKVTVSNNLTVTLNYAGQDEYPETSSVTVKHVYKHVFEETYTTTRAAIDETTGEEIEVVSGSGVRTVVEYDHTEDDDVYASTSDKPLYKNEIISIDAKPYGNYELEGELPNGVAANGQTITLTYVWDDTRDAREDGKVQVRYEYYVKKLAIKDGALVEKPYFLEATGSAITDDVKIGSTFDITPAPQRGNIDYDADPANVSSILVDKENNVVTLKYYRDGGDEDLTPAEVSVTDHFYNWKMTVIDGEARFYPEGIEEVSSGAAIVSPAAPYYVGMKVKVECASSSAFAVEGEDNLYEVILDSANTVLNNDYYNEVKLPVKRASINVSYTKETKIANGDTVTVTGTSIDNNHVDGYVGESKTVGIDWDDEKLEGLSVEDVKEIRVNGVTVYPVAVEQTVEPIRILRRAFALDTYTLNISENGDVVEFIMYHFENKSVPSELTLVNHIRTVDWNGEEISYVTEGSIEKLYVTNPVSVAVSRAGCTFDEIVADPADIIVEKDDVLAKVVLKEGKNTVNVYFTRTVDTRVRSEIILRHVYKNTDTYTKKTTEKFVEEIRNSFDDGIWVGNEFKATEKDYVLTNDSLVYTFKSVSPESITVQPIYNADGERVVSENPNVVELIYERSFSSQTGGGYTPTPDPVVNNDTPSTGGGTTPTNNDPQNNTPNTEPEPQQTEPELILENDDQALGTATGIDEPVEEDEMDLTEDDQALGDALVKTGTIPVTVFYGFGAVLMLAALILAFRKKREEA